MAVVAVVAGNGVVDRLPSGLQAVVASTAIANDRGVIHVVHGGPRRRRVTILADAGC